jgi:hypothetical protein
MKDKVVVGGVGVLFLAVFVLLGLIMPLMAQVKRLGERVDDLEKKQPVAVSTVN